MIQYLFWGCKSTLLIRHNLIKKEKVFTPFFRLFLNCENVFRITNKPVYLQPHFNTKLTFKIKDHGLQNHWQMRCLRYLHRRMPCGRYFGRRHLRHRRWQLRRLRYLRWCLPERCYRWRLNPKSTKKRKSLFHDRLFYYFFRQSLKFGKLFDIFAPFFLKTTTKTIHLTLI